MTIYIVTLVTVVLLACVAIFFKARASISFKYGDREFVCLVEPSKSMPTDLIDCKSPKDEESQ